MKKILFLITFCIISLNSCNAQELLNLDILKKQGFQVKMGELTGAGSKYSIHNLVGFILPEGVLMKENCNAIILGNSEDPKISDIVKIKFQNQEILSNELIGFVIR